MPNPLRPKLDALVEATIREHQLPGVQYSEPAGDPGWFGPGSPVWYVHQYVPSVILALASSGAMETLHPSTVYGSQDHSMIYERVNGVATGATRPEMFAKRFAQSLSFFMGTAFGSTAVAEKAAATVRAMHHRVHGVRPDGVPYDTREPEFFRWNYATVVWGFGRAHELYHPDPLTGADLDEYYLQYCKVGMELYAEDLRGAILPSSKKELDDYLLATSNKMSLSPPGAAVMELYRPEGKPVYLRPLMGLVHWAILDMLPDWARHMMSVPTRSGRVETAARRKAVSGLMKGIDLAAGGWPEIEQAHARATATPRPATAQQKVSALA